VNVDPRVVILDIIELMGRAYKDDSQVPAYKRARDWLEEKFKEAAKAAEEEAVGPGAAIDPVEQPKALD